MFSTDDEVAERKGSGWGRCEWVFLDGGESDEEEEKKKKGTVEGVRVASGDGERRGWWRE